MNTIDMVAEFQRAFGHEGFKEPKLPDTRTVLLRLHLLQEELGELTHAICAEDLVSVLDALTDLQYVLDGAYLAWGFAIQKTPEGFLNMLREPTLNVNGPLIVADLTQRLGTFAGAAASRQLQMTFDALEAFQVRLNVAYNEFGLAKVKHAAFAEVHRSNMTKLGDDGKPVHDGAGRVVKGPRYERPDLVSILKKEAA